MDLQGLGSQIQENLGSNILIFPWDLGDLGSRYGNIAVGS